MAENKLKLDTEVQFLKGVGPKLAEKLKKLGIETISDLIFHFPRAYKDYTNVTKIKDIQIQENYTLKVKVIGIENKKTSRRKLTVTEAAVADDSGSLQVVWFNQPYLSKMLKSGSELLLNGNVTFNRYSNAYVMESPDRAKKPSIVPVYPETKGVSSYYVAKLVKSIKSQVESLEEHLPAKILDKYGLMDYPEAALQLHTPANAEKLAKAKERLAFDELFFTALRAKMNKEELKKVVAPNLSTDETDMKKFVDSLPFTLTDDQRKAAWIIAKDMGGKKTSIPAMNRLLNGDVGSGKTVVAAFAIFVAYRANHKSILMAPTQVLANQHFETLKDTLEPFGVKIALITADSKKEYDLSSGEYDLIIGTQAILHLKEKIEDVGLVIVDEQHRFGVKQRAKIKELSLLKDKEIDGRKVRPHFLSMTATPIPRTLYLSLFSDLNITIIAEMPEGRKKVKTKFVSEDNRAKAYRYIRDHIEKGRQVFVICPLIEEQEDSKKVELFDVDKKSVVAEFEKLDKKIFPDLKIGMLHGRMKAKEKDETMAKFTNRELDILVSTSVVEVGVDIPNASIMMIEDAERFGLAQLHQFRGRVGRGEHQSYCFVFSNSRSSNSTERLKSFENISDGFKLAEIDLQNRGAGQVFGKIQSGHFDFIHADIGDRILVKKASEAAGDLVAEGIEEHPKTKAKLENIEDTRHFE